MKKILKMVVAVLALLVMTLIIGSCSNDPSVVEESSFIRNKDIREVSTNIYDDNISSAYMKVDGEAKNEDEAIAILTMKKVNWEKQFPTKRIVAMTIVYGNYHAGNGFHSYVSGLFIQYERR